RARTGQTHDVLLGPRSNKTVTANGDRLRLRILPVKGRDPAVEENEIHGSVLGLSGRWTKAGGQCAEPGQHGTAIWTENHDLVSLREGTSAFPHTISRRTTSVPVPKKNNMRGGRGN